MKRIILLSALTLCLACDDEKDAPESSKTDLLAGGSQKSWYLYARTPEEPCGSASDDSWTFFADGTLEYDHGTVTEDEALTCGDLVNLEGTWEFSNDETTITIVGLQEKGETPGDEPIPFDEPLTIMQADIDVLENEKFVLRATHPVSNIEYTFEFRKR